MSEPLDPAVVLGQRFRVVIEETVRHEAMVDASILIEELGEQWADFMRGDDPNEDDVYEFVKEMAHQLGVEEFLLLGADSPWASLVRTDRELSIEAHP